MIFSVRIVMRNGGGRHCWEVESAHISGVRGPSQITMPDNEELDIDNNGYLDPVQRAERTGHLREVAKA